MIGRRLALWLHGWVGITIGAWLAVVGLTGSLLVWRPEVEPRIDPRQRVTATSNTLSFQQIYDVVRNAYPKEKIDRIYVARSNNLAHEFRLRSASADEDNSLSVFVDPHNGRITGEQKYERDFYGRVDELHVRLLNGEFGHTLVGIAGGLLLLMSLSGLWLWWPRRGGWKRAFTPQLKTNWRGRNYELHRVTGALVCILLVGEGLTGMGLVWSEQTQLLVGTLLGGPKEKKPPKADKGALLSVDSYAKAALSRFPEAQISRITFPKKAKAPLVVRLHQKGELNPSGNTFVSFEPASGKVLKVEDSAKVSTTERFMNLRYPIHTGLWGGVLTRVLYTLLGLTLPAFYVSGLILWWNKWSRKRRARRASQEKASHRIDAVSSSA